jgi:transposase
VLSGHPVDAAAARALVLPNAVRSWLRLVARLGIGAALAKWEAGAQAKARPRLLQADPAWFRELAAKEKNPPRRKQMLALALVAEGISPHAAALAVGASHQAVYKRLERYRTEGTAAFHDGERYGLARKLMPGQLHELRAEILKQPDMDYRRLRAFVAARFGVRYGLAGLRLLLKRDLGIVRKEGSFIEAALPPPAGQPHPSSTRPAENSP